MARTYRRDSKGRFASGGGGGSGGKKAASTRAANTARAGALRAKGTTGLGARVKAKGFAGGKGAQQRAGGLRTGGTATARVKGSGVGAGTRRGLKASALAVTKARSRAASKGVKKMAKAPVSAAKREFQGLRKQQRSARRESELLAFMGNKGSRSAGAKAGAATRRINAMIAKRGRR